MPDKLSFSQQLYNTARNQQLLESAVSALRAYGVNFGMLYEGAGIVRLESYSTDAQCTVDLRSVDFEALCRVFEHACLALGVCL